MFSKTPSKHIVNEYTVPSNKNRKKGQRRLEGKESFSSLVLLELELSEL